MAQRETLQSIREWASASFEDEFAKFDDYIKTYSFTIAQFQIQLTDGLSTDKFYGVQVGSADGGSSQIYAWKDNEAFNVGKEFEKGKVQRHEDFNNPQIEFAEPFRWLNPTENEASLARFEALIRYLILSRTKLSSALTNKIAFFKEHFPGACRDIAEHVASKDTPIRTRAQTSAQAHMQRPMVTPTRAPSQTPMNTPTRPSRAPQSKSLSVASRCTQRR
jgi:hypothetical protein